MTKVYVCYAEINDVLLDEFNFEIKKVVATREAADKWKKDFMESESHRLHNEEAGWKEFELLSE